MFLTTAPAAPRNGVAVPPSASVAGAAGRAACEVLPAAGFARPSDAPRFCVTALPFVPPLAGVGVSAVRSAVRLRSEGSAGSALGSGAGAVGASDGADGRPGRCAACWTEPVPPESSAVAAVSVEDASVEDASVEDVSVEDVSVEDVSVEDVSEEDVSEEDVSVERSEERSAKNSCHAGSTVFGSSRKRWYISSTSHSFGPNSPAGLDVLLLDTLMTALI
jgi:hypothetical protein